MPHPLILRVKQISGQSVLATAPDGQTWTIPLEAVDGKPSVGGELRLIAVAPGAENAGETVLAKALLNELLGSNNS